MVVFKNHLTLVKIFENSIFYLVQDDYIYIYMIHIISHIFVFFQQLALRTWALRARKEQLGASGRSEEAAEVGRGWWEPSAGSMGKPRETHRKMEV